MQTITSWRIEVQKHSTCCAQSWRRQKTQIEWLKTMKRQDEEAEGSKEREDDGSDMFWTANNLVASFWQGPGFFGNHMQTKHRWQLILRSGTVTDS